MSDLALGAEFPAATAEQWRRLALAALRKSGAAGDDTTAEQVAELLATHTYDGLRIAALHTADDPPPPEAGLPGQWPFTRGSRASGGVRMGWDVRQRYTEPDPREAILADLENGATSIWLATTGETLAESLDGVYLDLAGLVLDAGDRFVDASRAWFALPGDPSKASGGFGADPLGLRARTDDASGLSGGLRDAAALAGRCVAEAPGMRAITVDATVFHEAGGSGAEELGCAIAAGVAYLRALTDAGLTAEAALGQLEFRYAATDDQFGTIVKLRAGRRLWARVAELCGAAEHGGQRQHAVTSAAMMTARDPWVNLLRTTIAAFAAGVGGADAVTVLPFDHALGRPDASSRRLARNTQLLLIEESQVARVIDPAGGSWYVERYTDQLAHAAWDWFTTIERAGGIAKALDGGLIADRLEATWQRRRDNLAHRRDPITGVSEFPNPGEVLPVRGPAEPYTGHRYAEDFERLRDRSDAAPQRPVVRLATIGSPAAYGPRVTFATNLFAAAGIAVTLSEDSGAAVVCVCGPDKAYRESGETVVQELRAAGARRILQAGRVDLAGVDEYVYTGCDAVTILTATLDDLGVPR